MQGFVSLPLTLAFEVGIMCFLYFWCLLGYKCKNSYGLVIHIALASRDRSVSTRNAYGGVMRHPWEQSTLVSPEH